MSVLLDEDTTTVLLKGLDFDVPCEAGEHAADVWVKCRFCQENAGALCHDHLRLKRAEAAVKLRISGLIGCAMCDTVAFEFDALFQAVPL